VDDQQPTGVRDQVGVVTRPPWCQRDHRADVAARRQVGGQSPAHRVTDYHHLGGVEVLAHGGEGDLRIFQRVQLGAVRAADLYCARRTSTPLPSRRRSERANQSMRWLVNCSG
jgi:hypothetical protein